MKIFVNTRFKQNILGESPQSKRNGGENFSDTQSSVRFTTILCRTSSNTIEFGLCLYTNTNNSIYAHMNRITLSLGGRQIFVKPKSIWIFRLRKCCANNLWLMNKNGFVDAKKNFSHINTTQL